MHSDPYQLQPTKLPIKAAVFDRNECAIVLTFKRPVFEESPQTGMSVQNELTCVVYPMQIHMPCPSNTLRLACGYHNQPSKYASTRPEHW